MAADGHHRAISSDDAKSATFSTIDSRQSPSRPPPSRTYTDATTCRRPQSNRKLLSWPDRRRPRVKNRLQGDHAPDLARGVTNLGQRTKSHSAPAANPRRRPIAGHRTRRKADAAPSALGIQDRDGEPLKTAGNSGCRAAASEPASPPIDRSRKSRHPRLKPTTHPTPTVPPPHARGQAAGHRRRQHPPSDDPGSPGRASQPSPQGAAMRQIRGHSAPARTATSLAARSTTGAPAAPSPPPRHRAVAPGARAAPHPAEEQMHPATAGSGRALLGRAPWRRRDRLAAENGEPEGIGFGDVSCS